MALTASTDSALHYRESLMEIKAYKCYFLGGVPTYYEVRVEGEEPKQYSLNGEERNYVLSRAHSELHSLQVIWEMHN